MDITLSGYVLITTCLCAIIALILDHIKRLPLYREAAKVSGPSTLLFIGNAHQFLGGSDTLLSTWMNLLQVYPSPFAMWLGRQLAFVLYEPEHLKIVMCSHDAIEKGEIYRLCEKWLGTGLFTAPTSKWRVHRRLIAPAFNLRILDTFIKVFSKQSEIMTDRMKKELNKGEFDIFHYVSLCALDIICETTMGVTVKAQQGYGIKYIESAERLTEILIARAFRFWLKPNFIYKFTKYARDERQCLKYVHDVTNDIIQKKKIDMNNTTRLENEENERTSRKPLLDHLMELSKDGVKLTDVEIREEVDTMLAAGSDTLATVNSFVLLMIANYPEVQEKVYQELCEIYGNKVSSDILVEKEDLRRMQYLERVIKETMRLFPVGPVLVRTATGDIKIGDLALPKGTSIFLSVITLHRNGKYWPNPLKFDPDRFLPEEVAKRDPWCYMPFSAGPRNCIGMRYAMMATKTLLSTLLRRYAVIKDEVVNIEDIKLKVDMMLKPVDPSTVRIVERTVVSQVNKK